MDLRPEEHDALVRLARYGALRLGQGSDAIAMTTAIRFTMLQLSTLVLRQGDQECVITAKGRAFRNRVAA
jgi:hypothetical protein